MKGEALPKSASCLVLLRDDLMFKIQKLSADTSNATSIVFKIIYVKQQFHIEDSAVWPRPILTDVSGCHCCCV